MIKKIFLMSFLLLLFVISKAQLTDSASNTFNSNSDIYLGADNDNANFNSTPLSQELDNINKTRNYTAAIVYGLAGAALITAGLTVHDLNKEETQYVVIIGAISEILAVASAIMGKNALDDGGKNKSGFLGNP